MNDSAAVDVVASAEPSNGIDVVSPTEVDGNPRLLDATLDSNAIFEPVNVRIYLPEDYETAPTRSYPTLYAAYDDKLGLYTGDDEQYIGAMNERFHQALEAENVNHRYCAGPGAHEWPYWQEDLADFLAHIYDTTPSTCPNDWGEPRS